MTQTETGFVRGLFQGRPNVGHLFPYPLPDAETRETADEIVAMVREWAADAIDPAAIDEDKAIPASVVDGLRELGLFGLTIEEEHGGVGMGQYAYARVMEAVAYRCASTVTILGAHLGIGMKGLSLYGTPEQKAKWMPALAAGEKLGAFALTEASAGSDAAALRTTAERLPDGRWKLDGRKVWITSANIAGHLTVFARTPHPTEPDAPLLERPISAFFVPADAPGVSVGAPEDKMGLRGSCTTEVGLEEVVVDADCLLGEEGQGFKVALNVLNAGRHGLAACCIGQAKLARELSLAHAHEREQFGQPIASFGMVAEMLAAMEADIYAMEAGTWLTAGLIDRGERDIMLESACCKMFATETLWRIANDALQVTGGTGFMREYAYERIVRDARINMIFEGTNQILRMMLVGQGLRGMDLASEAQPIHLDAVHEEFGYERTALEGLLNTFTQRARAFAAAHGRDVRDAQLPLRRLADQCVALFGAAAVLSRATAALNAGTATPQEQDLARLAARRRMDEARKAMVEDDHAEDELVTRIAAAMS